jgi:DNA-directed RNA polymerase subunit RPC12/RpoP
MSDPLAVKDITEVDNKTILECYKKEFTEESIEKILDALRPQGKWIKHEWGYSCSVCNETNDYAYDNNIHKFVDNYCPHCGAKMDGGEEE